MAQDGRVTRTSHGMAGRLYKRLVILPARPQSKPAISIVEVVFTRQKDGQDYVVNRWTFAEPDRARQHFKDMAF